MASYQGREKQVLLLFPWWRPVLHPPLSGRVAGHGSGLSDRTPGHGRASGRSAPGRRQVGLVGKAACHAGCTGRCCCHPTAGEESLHETGLEKGGGCWYDATHDAPAMRPEIDEQHTREVGNKLIAAPKKYTQRTPARKARRRFLALAGRLLGILQQAQAVRPAGRRTWSAG